MLLPNKGLNLTGWAGGSDGCSACTSQLPESMLLPQVKPKVVRLPRIPLPTSSPRAREGSGLGRRASRLH